MASSRRFKLFTVEQLEAPGAAALVEELVRLVQVSFAGANRATVARRVIFRDPASRYLVLYGPGGAVRGFCVYCITRHTFEGRRLGLLDGGIYFARGSRGAGAWCLLYILLGGLMFKLRNPRVTLCGLGIATNPAIYRLSRRLVPSLQPGLGQRPSGRITRLVHEVMAQRGLEFVDGDPWRVHIGVPVTLRREAQIREFVERSRDPEVAFFVERNPGYLQGHWLVVYSPLTLRVLASALASHLFGNRSRSRE